MAAEAMVKDMAAAPMVTDTMVMDPMVTDPTGADMRPASHRSRSRIGSRLKQDVELLLLDPILLYLLGRL